MWELNDPLVEGDTERLWCIECKHCGAQGPPQNKEREAMDLMGDPLKSRDELLGSVRKTVHQIARHYAQDGDEERSKWLRENVTSNLWAFVKGIPFKANSKG